MKTVKYIAVIICAIVILAIAAPFFQQRTPEAYVRARNLAIEMEPTATAAAIRNQEAAIHATIVAPAQATAEAASILANNRQRIDEDAHQQALRHEGEMAALTISNTQQLKKIDADYTAKVEGIKASGAKVAAEANADAARASAGAWRDTITYGGIAIGAVVLLVGAALAIVAWLSTRAKIINDPITGPILVTGRGIVMLGNVTTPVLAWNQNEPIRIAGESERPLVAQRQAFALIGKAAQSGNPEMARVAQHAATSAMQQSWSPSNAVLDSAVNALPSGRDELAGRVPTFADLLRTWQPSFRQMLLGIGLDGALRYCGLDDLLSTGVIGRPGTGKSTVLRFHYLQCRLVGARVVVWDLHRTIVKSLPGAEAFTRIDEINRSAEEMCAILDRRINADRYDDQPIMILADEFNLLAPNSPEVTEAMGRVILEGRKVKMFAMISGQGLPAKLFGDSTPRDALSSRFVLHTTTRQASMIGLDRDALPWVVDLKPGSAVVDGPIDPAVLSIPNTTEADVRALIPASGATSRAASGATSEPLPEYRTATSTEAAEVAESGISYGPEVAESVIRMWKDGMTNTAIISEVFGATGGQKYKDAAKTINQIIREALP